MMPDGWDDDGLDGTQSGKCGYLKVEMNRLKEDCFEEKAHRLRSYEEGNNYLMEISGGIEVEGKQ
jgi:hypothetical protein